MGASPDGLVLDTSDVDHPCGLLEIKCPAHGETTSLIDLCTKAQYKPSTFFLQYRNGEFHLKRTHDYYCSAPYAYIVPYAYTHMGRPYAYGTAFCPI